MAKDQEWEDEWGLSSGLPLDDADVTITAAEFGFNTQISASAVCLNVTFFNEDSEEEVEQSFSVGDGWELADKGERIATEDDKPRRLSNRSNYGRLVESAIEVCGGPENMPGRGFRFADTWVGTKWHLGTVKIESRNPNTNVTKTRDAIVFTEYRGMVEDEKPKGKASAGKSNSKADSKSSTRVGGGSKAAPANDCPIEDEELWAKLIEEAGKHDEHDDFMNEALEWDGVKGVTAVEKLVMSSGKLSVWKAAGK